MNKTINVSLARPGSGKTKKACRVLHNWVSMGRRVLFVIPTIPLAKQVCDDLKALLPYRIDSEAMPGPTHALNRSLAKVQHNLIVCQHAAFQNCELELLSGWTVIVDELPMPFTPRPMTVHMSDLEELPFINITDDNKLCIPSSRVEKAQAWVKTKFRSDVNGQRLFTEDCQEIYHSLIAGREVYLSKKDDSGVVIVYHWEESGIFERLERCSEAHILSATWQGTLFEWFATSRGFNYAVSNLTPQEPDEHRQKITIYPMLARGQCSKTVLDGGVTNKEGDSDRSDRVIQAIANKVIEAVGMNDKCLVFVQDWAKLAEASNLIFCKMDSRGINSYQNVSNVLCMFHGNHVTTATLCFQAVAAKYGRSYESLRDAWTRTFLLDATLQNAYRCSLRDSASLKPVSLYVQTYDVAASLKNLYMPNAVIDMQFCSQYKEFKPRGRKRQPKRDEIMALLAAGFTAAEIAQRTQLKRSTVYNYTRKNSKVGTDFAISKTGQASQND